MSYPSRAYRRYNFKRDQDAGLDLDSSKLDAELSALMHVANELNDALRGISTSDGALRFSNALREMDLVEETTIVATASQTAFTVPTYDTATDRVRAFASGVLIRPSLITLTDSTTVTLPAQVVGTIVVIEVFSAGAGTLTKLASTAADLGASLVAIEDAGGNYDATDVETALAEVAGDLADLVTALGAISNYVKKDGSVTMTGNLPMGTHKLTGLAAGTTNGDSVRYEQLTAVIASLASATSGFLAKTGGTMSGAIAMGSNKITGLADGTANGDAVNVGQMNTAIASFTGLPVGAIIDFGIATPPTGWLACDGTAVSRTTYANLFAVIGVTWGVGNGTTTFNVPDVRGRARIGTGSGSGLTARTIGATAGEETHLLITSEIPSHHHEILPVAAGSSGGAGNYLQGATNNDSYGSRDTGSTGGGDPHNNMQPSIAVPCMIKF